MKLKRALRLERAVKLTVFHTSPVEFDWHMLEMCRPLLG
jgi:hypothetical protein